MESATRQIPALALLAALCSGCAPGQVYLHDRGADLVGVVRLNVAYGPGVGTGVFATSALRLGTIGEHSRHVGFDGHGFGTWGQDRFDWHLLVVGHEYGHRNTPVMGSVEPDPQNEGYWQTPVLGGRCAPFRTEHVCGPLELGGRVHLLLVGTEIGIRLSELADFVCGICGFDPKGDDSRTREQWRKRPEQQEGQAAAAPL